MVAVAVVVKEKEEKVGGESLLLFAVEVEEGEGLEQEDGGLNR